jgi:hypothetical protein
MNCVMSSVWKVHETNMVAKSVTLIISLLTFRQHSRISHFSLRDTVIPESNFAIIFENKCGV